MENGGVNGEIDEDDGMVSLELELLQAEVLGMEGGLQPVLARGDDDTLSWLGIADSCVTEVFAFVFPTSVCEREREKEVINLHIIWIWTV